MALNPIALEKLLGKLKPGDAIASMGYPDILYPADKLLDLIGPENHGRLVYRQDSEDICKRHSLQYRQVPDAESLFELYGATLDVFDITAERGCEIVLDLNYPMPQNAYGQFDYVLDVGTLEHCFNAPQALCNMVALLKVGGIIIHENPFNWGNHGFWNLNPTLYADFYGANGCELLECVIVARNGVVYEVPRTGRFQYLDSEANCLAIAAKREDVDFKFPTQTKYRAKAWAKSS